MLIALIFISFILHLVGFYVIIHLFQRLKAVENDRPETMKKEIEETLTAYLINMQEENDELIAKLKPLIDNARVKKPQGNIVNDLEQPSTPLSDNTKEESDEWFPPVEAVKDEFETTLLAKAVNLQKKGYNVTEIARELDKGKGEIELLLKFNQKI